MSTVLQREKIEFQSFLPALYLGNRVDTMFVFLHALVPICSRRKVADLNDVEQLGLDAPVTPRLANENECVINYIQYNCSRCGDSITIHFWRE